MEIKEILGIPINDLYKLITNRENEYREDLNDIYSGKVVNNNDPDKQGKCQIRVYSVFDNKIPDSDLPWALPDFQFIGSKKGSFIVPPIGAIVKVYFDQGDIYNPHYTTKAVDLNNLSNLRLKNYPDTMIMFETDEGDYLTLNRKTKETIYNHNSGTQIIISKSGDITIDSKSQVIVKHASILKVEGSNVIPKGSGPLCGLPNCLYTGSPQTGDTCLP